MQRRYVVPALARLLAGERDPAALAALSAFVDAIAPVQSYARGRLEPGAQTSGRRSSGWRMLRSPMAWPPPPVRRGGRPVAGSSRRRSGRCGPGPLDPRGLAVGRDHRGWSTRRAASRTRARRALGGAAGGCRRRRPGWRGRDRPRAESVRRTEGPRPSRGSRATPRRTSAPNSPSSPPWPACPCRHGALTPPKTDVPPPLAPGRTIDCCSCCRRIGRTALRGGRRHHRRRPAVSRGDLPGSARASSPLWWRRSCSGTVVSTVFRRHARRLDGAAPARDA